MNPEEKIEDLQPLSDVADKVRAGDPVGSSNSGLSKGDSGGVSEGEGLASRSSDGPSRPGRGSGAS